MNQTCQYIQSIEQEMRIDLRLKRPHLRSGCEFLQLQLGQMVMMCSQLQRCRSSNSVLPTHILPAMQAWPQRQTQAGAANLKYLNGIGPDTGSDFDPFGFQLFCQDFRYTS